MDRSRTPGETASEESAAFREYPSKLFVESTTFCNLRCPMCIKQSEDSCIVDADMEQETFAALEPVFPHLESLVLNGIGEPLMHPRLLEWVRRARQAMPDAGWVGFQSNGLLLDDRWARDLVDAGLDRICLSVDGVTPETFSKVRQGEELSDMDQAFGVLAAARRRQPGSRLKVGAEFVTMQENISQLPDTIRWVAERGADFFIVSHAMPYDVSSVNQVSYDNCIDRAVEIYQKWEARIAAEGLDIHLYNVPDWERGRFISHLVAPDVARVLHLVDLMRAEARQEDVFMDIPRLMVRDQARMDRVFEVFAEAQAVADRYGLELKLPAAIPRYERKCDFVTGGSAFISWDGDVHPCYLLWHQCRCFINDWDKLVKPKVFGNVRQRPLLDIWRDEEFREFRRKVVEFNYPYCSNCCVAPCDLVQEEDFEQDCFTQNEPCGACQWAMGILQCLQ